MTVLKTLDFDTGDFSQWTTIQFKNAYSGTVVNDLRWKDAGYAARFEVRSGDDPIGDGHERAEVSTSSADINGIGAGGECWIGGATLLPDLATLNPTIGAGKTNIFLQVHEVAPSRSVPPIRVSLDTSGAAPYTIKVYVAGQGYPTVPVTVVDIGPPSYGAWMSWVMHAIWSPDPAIGLFEMWRDGKQVVTPIRKATMWIDDALSGSPSPTGLPQNVYFKQGYYRTNQAATSVVWHDETRIADSYQDAKAPPRVPPYQGQVVRVADGLGGFVPVFRHPVA